MMENSEVGIEHSEVKLKNSVTEEENSEVKTESGEKKFQILSDLSHDVETAEDGIVTKEMIKLEEELERKVLKEEKKLQKELMLEEEKKAEEERCFKRLQYLLQQSTKFSEYIAAQLKNPEEKENKMMGSNNASEKRGIKRKASGSTLKPKDANMKSVVLDGIRDAANYPSTQLDEETIKKRQPKLLTGGIMRPYQLEGFEWFKSLFFNAVNGILADEMGLGKTIQTIAFFAHLIEMGVPGPFIVCGPLSTVNNWHAEFSRFTPDIPVIVYHGHKEDRVKLIHQIHKSTLVNGSPVFPVVITSYQIALKDAAKLRSLRWKMLVIDEAHRIKNFQCKLIYALKQYNAPHRVLLTGTPLQNNLSELWSLLNFILPEIFNDLRVFQTWFDISRLSQSGANQEIIQKQQEKKIVSTIHQILTPFLLRRTKQEVELGLPAKKEIVLYSPLTKLQKDYYRMTLDKTIIKFFKPHTEEKELSAKRVRKTVYTSDLNEDVLFNLAKERSESLPIETEQSPVLLTTKLNLQTRNLSMLLRQICLHPYLISWPLNSDGECKVDENIVSSSGKLQVLDVLLPKLKGQGHKVLIFSQFVKMLNILEDYCIFRNFNHTRLDGSMALEERTEEIADFVGDSSVFIFLISTRAGGLGINLSQADTVIIFDSDWNPQNDLQAQDRCHRIGQKRPVIVYRLVVPNTIDETITSYATNKRKLEKVIMQKGRFATRDTLNKKQDTVTTQELLRILESSDVNSYVKTDEKFLLTPSELKTILDRSDLIS